jgi:Cu+-exporting ATPase
MTCASCVARIEHGLRDIPGVADVRVSLATERATLTYDPDQVSVDALVAAIHALGYEVPLRQLTFAIGGMSCASCVTRVEQGLLSVPGVVRASVNLAAEKASIEASPTVAMADLTRAVEATGYTAAPMEEISPDHDKAAREQESRRLGRKALVGALLSTLLTCWGASPRGSHGCRGCSVRAWCSFSWPHPCTSGLAGSSIAACGRPSGIVPQT